MTLSLVRKTGLAVYKQVLSVWQISAIKNWGEKQRKWTNSTKVKR